MNHTTFWRLIDEVWAATPHWNQHRQQALDHFDPHLIRSLEEGIDLVLLPLLCERLAQLTQVNLTAFIHRLEERIHHLDRLELYKAMKGSDDGFLYGRCFVLAVGEYYYHKIDQTPAMALPETWAEGFGFAAYQVYEEQFDVEFDRYQFHSMESHSNSKGWPQ